LLDAITVTTVAASATDPQSAMPTASSKDPKIAPIAARKKANKKKESEKKEEMDEEDEQNEED